METLYVMEDEPGLRILLNKTLSSEFEIRYFLEDEIDKISNEAKEYKKKIVVDISRRSNYIFICNKLKKVFINNKNLLYLLVNKKQMSILKTESVFSGRIRKPETVKDLKTFIN